MMISTRTIYDERTFNPRMGFAKGKIVAQLKQLNPWRMIEITPDKLEFSTEYLEQHDYYCLRVKATLLMNPTLEEALQRIIAAGLMPQEVLVAAKENGQTSYSMIIPDITEEEFMASTYMPESECLELPPKENILSPEELNVWRQPCTRQGTEDTLLMYSSHPNTLGIKLGDGLR